MKRFFISYWRVIKTGTINFFRNAWLAAAAIAVMVITLTIVLFSIIANATFSNTVAQITDKIDISVYLIDDITDEQRDQLITELNNFENVESVEYISKEEALERYKQQNQDNLELIVAISQTDNPLPASLQVKPDDPNQIQQIKDYLEQPDIQELQSEETSYSGDRKEAIDKIASATAFFRRAGLIGIAIFALISVLIIFNTIRMAIFNRREELAIMRLLGASTWYIRGPYVVETIYYGIISALLAVLVCHTLFTVQSSAFDANTFGLLDVRYANSYFSDNLLLILGSALVLGILIGALSSFVATRRYLKFKTKHR